MMQVILDATTEEMDRTIAKDHLSIDRQSNTSLHLICDTIASDVPILNHMLLRPGLAGHVTDGDNLAFRAMLRNQPAYLETFLEAGCDFGHLQRRVQVAADSVPLDVPFNGLSNGRLLENASWRIFDVLVRHKQVVPSSKMLAVAVQGGYTELVRTYLEAGSIDLNVQVIVDFLCTHLPPAEDLTSTHCPSASLRLLLQQPTLYVHPVDKLPITSEYAVYAQRIKQESILRRTGWTRQFLTTHERPWILDRARAVVMALQYRIGLPPLVVFMILTRVTCSE